MRLLALLFTASLPFAGLAQDQSPPQAPIVPAPSNGITFSPTQNDLDLPVKSENALPKVGVPDRKRTAEKAAQNLSMPDKRVYVEYGGELLPLKGFAKAAEVGSFGETIRVPLSPQELKQLQFERKRLEHQAQPLREKYAMVQASMAKLGTEIAQKEKEMAEADQPSAPSASRLQTDLAARFRELSEAKAEMQRLEGQERQFNSQEAFQLREIEKQFDQLKEVEVSGKVVYRIVRVDEAGIVTSRRRNQRIEAAPFEPDHSTSNQNSRSSAATVERRGYDYRRPEFRLPAPSDPNDLFASTQTESNATRIGLASESNGSILAEATALQDLTTAVRFNPTFGGYYDTRSAENIRNSHMFNVGTISTKRTAADGQTKFVGAESPVELSGPLSFLLDTQTENLNFINTGENQIQLFAEGNNYQQSDQVEMRHLFARLWDKGTWSFTAGKTHSLYNTNGLMATAIQPQVFLVGTSGLGANTPKQFRVQQNLASTGTNLGWGVGIEDSESEDVLLGNAATKLVRWPNLSGNLTYTGNNQVDRIQLSGLLRSFGAQLPSGAEDFEQGWGLSLTTAYQLRKTPCSSCTIFSGVNGGQGVGNYINGVSTSAIMDSGALSALNAVGTFAGFKYQRTTCRGWQFSSNLAFGAVSQGSEPTMATSTNTHLYHAWVNAYLEPNKYIAIGGEWQYGRRITLSDSNGENARIFLGIQLTSRPATKKTSKVKDVPVGDSEKWSIDQRVSSDRQLMNSRERRSSFAHLQGL